MISTTSCSASKKRENRLARTWRGSWTVVTFASRCSTNRLCRCTFLFSLSRSRKRLDGLEFHDFDLVEVDSFETLTIKDADALESAGLKIYDRKPSIISFLTSEVKNFFHSIKEEAWVRKYSRIKALAINAGLVKLLPWEAPFFERTGAIPGIRTTVKIPDGLLEDIGIVRDAVAEAVQANSCVTFADMKKVVAAEVKTFDLLEWTFSKLEVQFLNDSAEKIGLKMVRDLILAALPTSTKHVSIAQVH